MSYLYKTGDKIEIRINTGDLSQEKWEPGRFLSYVPCTIGHKFNVQLADGSVIKGISPECVRRNEKQENN